MARLRQVVWELMFLADRGEDQCSSCGVVLAIIVLGLGGALMAALGWEMVSGWTR